MKKILFILFLLFVESVQAYSNQASPPIWGWWKGENFISQDEAALDGYCKNVSCRGYPQNKLQFCVLTTKDGSWPPVDVPQSEWPNRTSRRTCVYNDFTGWGGNHLGDYLKGPRCPKGTSPNSNGSACICPIGAVWINDQCATPIDRKRDPDKEKKCPDHSVGNPISLSSACKIERAHDVPGMLPLNRVYQGNTLATDADTKRLFGKRWVTQFDMRLWDDSESVKNNTYRCYFLLISRREFCPNQSVELSLGSEPSVISVSRPHGGRDVFTLKDGKWQSDRDITSQLRSEVAANGEKQWIFTDADGVSYEKFSAEGRLLSLHSLNGTALTLTYSNGGTNDSAQSRWPAAAPVCKSIATGEVLPAGRLLCVTDQFQRQLNFEYDDKGRVTEVLDAAGKRYRYEYDGASGGLHT